jgi:hypothetical protein
MRLLAGLNGTVALAETKMPKVGVPLLLIVVATVSERQHQTDAYCQSPTFLTMTLSSRR